jgi:hypothetical protein
LNSRNQTKALWNIIKNETGKGFIQNQKISLEIDSILVTNPQYLSHYFKDDFVEGVGKMVTPINDAGHVNQIFWNTKTMFLTPITEKEILGVTGKLNSKYSTGFVGIRALLIKHCVQHIIKPLTIIYNLSLSTGTFPNLIKIAKVRPIFKKGRKQDVSNYRPISILTVFSKILELIMYNRVVSFLNKHNLITSVQNGFHANKSTYTAIQSFIEETLNALDSKYLDLSKAFDIINHDRLQAKLELYTLRGKIHE